MRELITAKLVQRGHQEQSPDSCHFSSLQNGTEETHLRRLNASDTGQYDWSVVSHRMTYLVVIHSVSSQSKSTPLLRLNSVGC